ncbi:putative ATPase [Lentzea atacamensis]|uniref:ATPase n=1 Tax=Lentzea atacamensis TaxID=531938 RepID=A0ABX9DWI6_9PSEU|nr:tetratricopeptide repeat protein [Lentzea atacamensis]RAS59776.1 putative ATPase [Lentzea atacamensis]
MGDVRFLVLGPLRVELDGHPVDVPEGRGRTILATLLAHANEIVPLHEFGDPAATRTAISRLRRALGPANRIRTHNTGYFVQVSDSDLLDFHALRGQGRYAEALALWRGEPFEDVDGVDAIAAKLAEERKAVESLLPVPRQLPAPPAHFAGRDRELAALHDSGPVTVLSGTGGTGKTTLALQWANEEDFPAGQLHVNLRGFASGPPAKPEDVIRGFLGALGVPPDHVPANTGAQTALYRKLLRGKRMLILLDNARDADHVRPLLPGDPACRVLITSRNRMDDLDTAGLPLDALGQSEAEAVLSERIGPRAEAEPAALARLVRICAGLPLALAIVAARADPEHSLTALAHELETADVLDFLETGDETTSPRSVFDWSYQRLSGPAQRLFRLLGVHPGPDVSAAAAMSLMGGTPPLAELTAAGLVTMNAAGRFELHDLVRAYARDLGTEQEERTSLRRLMDHYLHSAAIATLELNRFLSDVDVGVPAAGVVPETVHGPEEAQRWFRAEIDVLTTVCELAVTTRFDRHAWQLVWAIRTFMDITGRWHQAIALLHGALPSTHRLEDERAAALLHQLLAHTKHRLSDMAVVEPHLAEALRLFERTGGLDGQIRAHRNYAHLMEANGDLPCALHHARRAAELSERAGDISGLAGSTNQVGWYHGLLGEHAQALEHCRTALTLHRDCGDRLGEASALDSIAYNLHHVGDFPGAITHYRESLRVFEEIGEQFEIATTLVNLGDTHVETGDVHEARQVWQEAEAIYERLGHADVAKARHRLTEWAAGPSSG